MLHGCKHYFSFFGILLFSVNMTLKIQHARYESLIRTMQTVAERFLKQKRHSPLFIQQKVKIYHS